MSVKSKLVTSFFIIIILFTIAGVVGFNSLNNIHNSVNAISSKNIPQKNIISQSVLTMEKAISNLKTYVMSYEESAILVNNIHSDLDILRSYLEILRNGEKKSGKTVVPKLNGENLKLISDVINDVEKIKTIMEECVSVHRLKVDLHFELYSKIYDVEIYFYRLSNKDFSTNFKDWYKEHKIKNKKIQKYIDEFAKAYDKMDLEKQKRYSTKVIKTAARTLDMIEESERVNFKLLMDRANSISKRLQKVEKDIQNEFIASQEQISQIFSRTFIFNILVIIATITGSIIIATYISKNLIGSLNSFQKSLVKFFKFINNETKEIELIDISSKDEFGQMALVLNKNIETSSKLHREIAELLEFIDKNVISSEIDSEGIITNVSEALCRITGYGKNELVGKPHTLLIDKNNESNSFDKMFEIIKSGKVFKGEIKNLRKDGSSFWVNIIASPKYDKEGSFSGYTALKHDINTQKEIEELKANLEIKVKERTAQLEQEKEKAQAATVAKGEFLANMSHEIRTPLNAVLGFLALLKERISDEKSISYLNVIDRSSNTLLGIINDILDFSKIESKKLKIEYIDFAPREEFEILAELFNAKCAQKNITFKLNLVNLPECLKSDLLRIKQVISNLLSNAVKFTPENKSISLHIEYMDTRVHVSVKDEGIGIAEDKIALIFEDFTQADDSTSRKYGGSGLGLAISSKLVSLLGGELKVKSKIDRGSEFYFSFPAKVCKQTSGKIDNRLDEETYTGKKILLVEDNLDNQMLMKEILKKLEVDFDVAGDGIEAVEAFKKNSYDAILMDKNMPNMDGIEATKHILEHEKRNDLPHTPVIALTANALSGDKEEFMDAGMDDYLTKPVDIKKLQKTLSKFICTKTIEEEKTEDNLPEFKTLDKKYALNLVMGMETVFLQVLKGLVKYKDIKLEALEDEEFQRTMHTLKGLTASAGALKLRELAKEMEKTLNRELIPLFTTKLNETIEEIEQKLPAEDIEKKGIDKETRDELFGKLKEAVHTKRAKNCKPVIEELEKYSLTPEDEKLFVDIKKLTSKFKFKEALELF